MARKINLNITDFREFRRGDFLYVDKSPLIEHLVNDANNIYLFCRPRRVGKTMNLSMLRYFFDMQEKSAELFKGLYIETSHVYKELNQYPVIYLSFKDMRKEDYEITFVNMVENELKKYIQDEKISKHVNQALVTPYPNSQTLLKNVCKNIYDTLGLQPIILIDEYDKPMMDSIDSPEFEDIRSFIKSVLSSALKDNPYLKRAVMTGVNRVAQESIFSDLNNISIVDVFKASIFDTDFGFTEKEIIQVWDEAAGEQEYPFDRDDLRNWYNSYRIGDSIIYFTFSVMSAMQSASLNNYWGRSGIMDIISANLTPKRVEQIIEIVNGYPGKGRKIVLKDRLTIGDLRQYDNDDAFYSMLIQTGYMTYDIVSPGVDFFKRPQIVRLANKELRHVWEEFILRNIFTADIFDIEDILLRHLDKPELLARELTKGLSNRLSYFDFDVHEPEKTYHVFIAGILSAFGYSYTSNRESGYGRYDIAVELKDYNMIFEFKKAERHEDMEASAQEAIEQIRRNRYVDGLNPEKRNVLVGIGFCDKMCKVVVS